MPLVDTISNIKVHPNKIVIWKENIYDSPNIRRFNKFIDSDLNVTTLKSNNLRRNIHHNKLSKSSIKKCKRAIDYLLINSSKKTNYSVINYNDIKFKIAFITLTLPATQIHSDNVIKRECLNQFLINAKRLWNIENYVWRAERQQNGNVHFHILVDKFIPWQEIRGLWNRLIAKLGYIEMYRNNMKDFHSKGFKVRTDLLDTWSYKNQLKAYQKGKHSNWSNPNTTDIHSVRFINNVGAYVTKYMIKNELMRKTRVKDKDIKYVKKFVKGTHSLSFNVIKYLNNKAEIGRLWGCNIELTQLKGGEDILNNELSLEINRLLKHPRARYFEDSYCKVLNIDIKAAIEYHCINIVYLLSEFLTKRFILKDTS